MSLETRIRTLASTIGARVKAVETSVAGKANASHTHAIGDLPVASSGTVNAAALVRADDSRLSDARTPLGHTHSRSQITDLGSAAALDQPGAGTNANTTQVVRGDDSRLSDARTPLGHSHVLGDLPSSLVVTTDSRLSDARTPVAHTHVASAITDPNNLPGAEIAYAEKTSNTTTTNTTAGNTATTAVIQSLSITVTGVGRDIDIEFIAVCQHSVASGMAAAYLLCNGSYTAGPGAGYLSAVQLGAVNSGRTLYFKRRVAVPAGQSYTYTVGIYTNISGTVTVVGATATPTVLMATRV